jgi:hypothetical protein
MSIKSQFLDHSANLSLYTDSLTVMVADTRHGMESAVSSSYTRIKERAANDPRVAGYVARIDAAVGKHAAAHIPTRAASVGAAGSGTGSGGGRAS